MIHLFKPTAQWLVLMLRWMAKQPDSNPLATFHDYENTWRDSEDDPLMHDVYADIAHQLGDIGTTLPQWADFLAELKAAIFPANPPDETLIDRIIEILQLPNTSNVLSGRTLDALRKALLSQDELRGLDERLKAANRHCGRCGKDLVRGEMTYMSAPGNAQVADAITFLCTRCGTPQYRACEAAGCDAVVSATAYHTAKLATRLCPNHQPGKKKVEEAIQEHGRLIPMEGGAVAVDWGAQNWRIDADPPGAEPDDALANRLDRLLAGRQPGAAAPPNRRRQP